MAERRALAETALKHLCDRIGVLYTTEDQPIDDAWFLETVSRSRVNIMQWNEQIRTRGRGISQPLGGYGLVLTHEQVYDRCWFADRILTARSEAMTHNRAKTDA